MNFILLFYPLPENVNVSRFKINIYNKWIVSIRPCAFLFVPSP